ncbi:MAG TPA: hypothetical protein VHX15_08500, partial [Frankiaceae bacterium]|nr:hypothetical protein [Frankiaceae bacterium]
GGITVVQLHAQARTAKDSLAGLTRWGYVRVADSVVTATREGRTAQRVWEPLAMEIESRWASRFEAAYQQLRGTLETFAAAIEVDFPDYLPITSPTQNGRLEPFRPLVTGVDPRGLDLSALLSRVLLAYTLDFERESAISLPVSANTLRVLDAEPIPLRDLPRLSGVLQPYPDGWRAKAGAPQALPHHPMVLHRGGFPDGS